MYSAQGASAQIKYARGEIENPATGLTCLGIGLQIYETVNCTVTVRVMLPLLAITTIE